MRVASRRAVSLIGAVAFALPASAEPLFRYYGGKVVSNARVVQVYWTSAVNPTAQSCFLRSGPRSSRARDRMAQRVHDRRCDPGPQRTILEAAATAPASDAPASDRPHQDATKPHAPEFRQCVPVGWPAHCASDVQGMR